MIMHRKETPEPSDILQSVTAFLQIGPERGVNNYIVEGPTDNVPSVFTVFAAVFSRDGSSSVEQAEMAIIATREVEEDAMSWYSSILAVELSQRLAALEIQTEPHRTVLVQEFHKHGLPFICLAFGHQMLEEEPVTLLASVWGFSPREALDVCKKIARTRLSKFN